MADFLAVTACNDPKIQKPEAVEKILSRYYRDPELRIGVGFDEADGAAYLFLYGYVWPEAWPIPEDVADFDPYGSDAYEEGDDGFCQLLRELAPYLQEPLIVQAVGSIKCRYPLSACEWRIRPRGKKVHIQQFRGDRAFAHA